MHTVLNIRKETFFFIWGKDGVRGDLEPSMTVKYCSNQGLAQSEIPDLFRLSWPFKASQSMRYGGRRLSLD